MINAINSLQTTPKKSKLAKQENNKSKQYSKANVRFGNISPNELYGGLIALSLAASTLLCYVAHLLGRPKK